MEENKIVIYQTEDVQTQIDVRLENETVWPFLRAGGSKRPEVGLPLRSPKNSP